MKKKELTAVEWLVDQMRQLKEQRLTLSSFVTLSFYDLEMFAENAKEMEKDQREKDFIEGYKKRAELSNLIFDEASELSAKQLFKQQEQ